MMTLRNTLRGWLQPPASQTLIGRRLRSREVGRRIYLMGVILSVAASLLDVAVGFYPSAVGGLILCAGCLASSRLVLRPRADHAKDWSWIPAYACFWVSAIPIILTTGGSASPFLTPYLGILFLGGMVLASPLPPAAALGFALTNYLAWCAASVIWAEGPLAAVLPPLYVFLKLSLFLAALIACIAAFVNAEMEMGQEALRKERELAETRDQLGHAARMAEVGNLMATTAHELAQPVQVISTVSSLLRRNLDPQATAPLLERLAEAADRVNRMVTRFRDFARRDHFEPRRVDLREIARSVALMTELDLKARRIPFVIELPAGPAWAHVDSLQTQQALLNLVNNARDALLAASAPGGRISLRVTETARFLRVEVINGGPGIALETQSQLFRRYFTTKPKGMGTGLGLDVCRRIMEQHRGRILFCSGDGETRFVIDFPRLEGEPAAGLARSALEADPVDRPGVVIGDQHGSVRKL
jgi:signal transduction histidine kinase